MLFNEDSRFNTLDEVSTGFCRTPLHIAAMCDDVQYAEEILGSRLDLARKRDSQGLTPLHLASTRESLRMVKLLVDTDSEACVDQDQYGRTPLHLAVMKDQITIMEKLIRERPEAIQKRHDRDENLLHFCVKHNKFKALKLLVKHLAGAQPANQNDISVNSRDNDGNTILHLAAEMKNFKIMKYLVEIRSLPIEINAVNNNNKKAFSMLSQTESDDLEFGFYDDLGRAKKKQNVSVPKNDGGDWLKKRVNALMLVATLIAGIACQAATNPPGGVWQEDSKVDSGTDPITYPYYLYHMFGYPHLTGYWDEYYPRPYIISNSSGNFYWLGNTTVVASNETRIFDFINSQMVIAPTYSKNVLTGMIIEDANFKSIVSDYNRSGGSPFPYIIRYAGFPILAYTYPMHYTIYMVTNTVAFLMSATIILLVICGFMNDASSAQVRLLVVLMCISVGCITFGYLTIFLAMTPDFHIRDPILYSIAIYIGLWCICGITLFIWKLISYIVKVQRIHLVGVHRYLKRHLDVDLVAVHRYLQMHFYVYLVRIQQYLKRHFHVNVKHTAKLTVLVCGICVFFIVLAVTIYPSFYTPLTY